MAGPGDPRYTQKTRAKRITLDYFKRPHPFRRWRFILSVAAPLVAVAWLLVYAGQGDQRIYNSGTVSTAHHMFETDCKVCHGPGPAPGVTPAGFVGPRGYWARVSDNACTACHAGPQHHANEPFTPSCASCHIEHKGRKLLVEAADQHCTQCHRDLKTRDGQPSVFQANIPSFRRHPQFAVDVRPKTWLPASAGDKPVRVRLDDKAKLVDNTPIKLNHARHQKPGLQGLDKVVAAYGPAVVAKVQDAQQLKCTFCHRPDATWQYMRPVTYREHCAVCHELGSTVGSLLAPHEKPPFVRAFVLGAAADLFRRCKDKMPPGDEGTELAANCEAAGLAVAAAPAAPGSAPASAPAEETPRARGRSRGGALSPDLRPDGVRLASLSDDMRGLLLLTQRSRRGGSEEEAAPATPSAPAEQPAEGSGRRRRRGGEDETPPPAAGGGGAAGGGTTGGGSGAAGAWATEQLANAENALFKMKDDGCQKCHTFDDTKKPATGLPEVAAPKIPARWLPHSKFDHAPHRPVACGECHKAATSSKTDDVLLPTLETCKDCHQARGGARTGCVECHRYHDKSKERDADGPFKVPQLLSGLGRKGPIE
jgi:hypothetical protein